MLHELKIWPVMFDAVKSGEKTFELRRDDRDFNVEDHLFLREWDSVGGHTKRKILVRVTYVLRQAERFGLAGDFCAMSIERVVEGGRMPERATWKALPHGEVSGSWGVYDSDDAPVVWQMGGCNRATAEQIASEHNTHGDLLDALEAVVSDVARSGNATITGRTLMAVQEAIDKATKGRP